MFFLENSQGTRLGICYQLKLNAFFSEYFDDNLFPSSHRCCLDLAHLATSQNKTERGQTHNLGRMSHAYIIIQNCPYITFRHLCFTLLIYDHCNMKIKVRSLAWDPTQDIAAAGMGVMNCVESFWSMVGGHLHGQCAIVPGVRTCNSDITMWCSSAVLKLHSALTEHFVSVWD